MPPDLMHLRMTSPSTVDLTVMASPPCHCSRPAIMLASRERTLPYWVISLPSRVSGVATSAGLSLSASWAQ